MPDPVPRSSARSAAGALPSARGGDGTVRARKAPLRRSTGLKTSGRTTSETPSIRSRTSRRYRRPPGAEPAAKPRWRPVLFEPGEPALDRPTEPASRGNPGKPQSGVAGRAAQTALGEIADAASNPSLAGRVEGDLLGVEHSTTGVVTGKER